MSNAPLGADEDSKAPWNQPLNVKHKRFVSVTLSYYDEVELPPDAEESEVIEAFNQRVYKQDFPEEVSFDEVVIM